MIQEKVISHWGYMGVCVLQSIQWFLDCTVEMCCFRFTFGVIIFAFFLVISISSSSNEKWSIYHGLYSIFRFERLGMDGIKTSEQKSLTIKLVNG